MSLQDFDRPLRDNLHPTPGGMQIAGRLLRRRWRPRAIALPPSERECRHKQRPGLQCGATRAVLACMVIDVQVAVRVASRHAGTVTGVAIPNPSWEAFSWQTFM